MSEEHIRRGEQAARVLGEKVVQEAIKGILDEIESQWLATPARDAEAREWLWRHAVVAKKFEQTLKQYIETGKFEAHKEKQTLTDRIQRLVA